MSFWLTGEPAVPAPTLTESSKKRGRTVGHDHAPCNTTRSMDTIDFTQIGARKITREEFVSKHARQAQLSLEEFDRYLYVVVCDCGDPACEGWAAQPRYAKGKGWYRGA